MSLEAPNINEFQSPLRYWFEELNKEDQLILDNDIFNQGGGIALEKAFEMITDQEVARQIMGMFRSYLILKNEKTDNKVLKIEAKNIADFIERKAFPEESHENVAA